MSYLHAGGIDRPLAIWKEGVGSVRPHQNWRGLFASGTWGYNDQGTAVGTTANCVGTGLGYCLPLNWPGNTTTAWHESSGGGSELWMGGLVDGMRDATGQIYMRNLYYNPQTGQFTQMDPMGIAGGLNAYGFAVGDPVTYSDPFGLTVCGTTEDMRQSISNAFNAHITWDSEGCVSDAGSIRFRGGEGWAKLQRRFLRMVLSPRRFVLGWGAPGSGSRFRPMNSVRKTYHVSIDRTQAGAPYPTREGIAGYCGHGPNGKWTIESLIVHELGHGYGVVDGWFSFPAYQGDAIEMENLYYNATPWNEPERCGDHRPDWAERYWSNSNWNQ